MAKALNNIGRANVGKLFTTIINDVLKRIEPVVTIDDLGEFELSLRYWDDSSTTWETADSLSSCKIDSYCGRKYLDLGIDFIFSASFCAEQHKKLWTIGKTLFPEVSEDVNANVCKGIPGLANIIFNEPAQPTDFWRLCLIIVYLPKKEEIEEI